MPLGSNLALPQVSPGHGQLSTDTYMLALNITQVSDLGPRGPLVLCFHFVSQCKK